MCIYMSYVHVYIALASGIEFVKLADIILHIYYESGLGGRTANFQLSLALRKLGNITVNVHHFYGRRTGSCR